MWWCFQTRVRRVLGVLAQGLFAARAGAAEHTEALVIFHLKLSGFRLE